MLHSSRVLASHIRRGVLGGGGKSYNTKNNAALRDIRQSSRVPLALMAAAAGSAVCYAAIASNDEHDTSRFMAPLSSLVLPMPKLLVSNCEAASREAKLQRKKTAVAASLQRLNTRQQVSKLRTMKDELLDRWQKDEEGWRNLPSRAWPEYQPNQEELEGIVAQVERLGCSQRVMEEKPSRFSWFGFGRKSSCSLDQCKKLLFDMASGLVFYQVDPVTGFALYEALAKRGHTDAMVACGIVLIEGLGVSQREHEGLAWLEKAVAAHDSSNAETTASMAQASYELGCVYYTGIDGIVEEDAEKAFGLFEKAAEQEHTAALYMVADCLVEGDGTERNVSKAVPLFYKAAERGHRYSRQRIRELLQHGNYPE
eukprot:CAMPEP_0116124610 /NCGR_PEP_ID=MMETSP0329-20121206/5369_1 /TAXON_ID=697910 /ORGANISM="Pseudo-nitzschia arenysensis, Strain B593" /LENGTH=368 /DNA_ID=CAMNT_0003618595 /DNA_START=42 /DNA_END=1148 /DNA_ORIENTATION=+